MIDKPQIFVMYGTGMFGTFITTLFSHHPDADTMPEGEGLDEDGVNAHSNYKRQLDNFHDYHDYYNIEKMNHEEKVNFFKPLKEKNIGIHRFSGYLFANLPFDDHFKNYVKIIIIAKEECYTRYAKRHVEVGGTNVRETRTEWWESLSNKPINKLPWAFVKGMKIKEKEKVIKTEIDDYLNKNIIDPQHDIIFDPDDIQDINKLQELVDQCCKMLKIKSFTLPKQKIEQFVDLNKIYFDNVVK